MLSKIPHLSTWRWYETNATHPKEFVPGGDFRTLLNASGVLHENHARFYLAEMLCSVFSLHKLGYIHRDLKPENFLLDAQGHIKLTDFGLCKGRLSSEIVGMLQQKVNHYHPIVVGSCQESEFQC